MPPLKRSSDRPARSYTLGSVDNALKLILALRTHRSLGVKEAAELLDVVPSTAHRLLTTLQAHGFVAQDGASRRYVAGPALVEVALASLEHLDVRRVAHPHLVGLAAEVRETASLVVLEGTRVRFLDSVEGPELVRVADRTGEVLAAHRSSVGQAILAGLPERELLRLYPDENLPEEADGTPASRRSLLEELVRVRRQGYASVFGQSPSGLSAVAVPVDDGEGRVLAAIGVSVPASRLDRDRVQRIASAARIRARRIGEELMAGPASLAPLVR